LREALFKDGRAIIESLLNDGAVEVPEDFAQEGEKYQGRCAKIFHCLFGAVEVHRNYYYHPKQGGRFPLDQALGMVGSETPALARVVCRAGALCGGYLTAAQELREIGAIEVDSRQIQRVIERIAPKMLQDSEASIESPKDQPPVPMLYVSVDGPGVPMLPAELVGRKGKQPDGKAKTREMKLGCVFTQHRTNAQGEPIRDPDSTTYLCGLESAVDFGTRLRHEGLRRGMAKAAERVFLGDGAAWVWEIARVNFAGAILILDYFHALEHLTALTEAIFGVNNARSRQWRERWKPQLWEGQVDRVLGSARRQASSLNVGIDGVEKELNYFQRNREKMRYGEFRKKGYFIGSGVVEAGCRTVIGQRAKLSGMRWSEDGVTHVLSIRCLIKSGRFDSFWRSQTQPASSPQIMQLPKVA
jgi:hypothetical protein